MPRSAPSQADQDLLNHLAEEGFPCSRHQLERWRQHGLLPRAQVLHLGARGNVATHPDETREIAATLAANSARGRPWQVLGLVLIADGLVDHMTIEVIRACLRWCIETAAANERKRIDHVTARLHARHITQPDPVDIAEAVACLTGSRIDRATLHVLMPLITRRYPHWPARRRRALIRSGTVWTVAEYLGEELTDDLKAITQGWDTWEEMRDAQGDRLGRPTLDDQRVAVSTLTGREFALLWWHVALTGIREPLYVGGTLARAATQLRYVYSKGYGHSLPEETLDGLFDDLEALLADSDADHD